MDHVPLKPGRRAELADFLRTRRATLRPENVGLPTGRGRRRTPGLRRQEVADLAGISPSWYTWLEQGRAINPSSQVLAALARALVLSPSGERHLFHLAGVAPPEPRREDALDPATTALLDGLLPHIAYVLGPTFDVVAHNRAAELIMSDLLMSPRPNLLRWLFTGDGWGGPEWERTARGNLLDFRSEYALRPGEPTAVAVIDELSERSSYFRRWWADHEVQALEPAAKQIQHRDLGGLSLLSVQTRPAHAPSLRIRILVPADETTRDKLAEELARDQ